jgi:hypothetical protein
MMWSEKSEIRRAKSETPQVRFSCRAGPGCRNTEQHGPPSSRRREEPPAARAQVRYRCATPRRRIRLRHDRCRAHGVRGDNGRVSHAYVLPIWRVQRALGSHDLGARSVPDQLPGVSRNWQLWRAITGQEALGSSGGRCPGHGEPTPMCTRWFWPDTRTMSSTQAGFAKWNPPGKTTQGFAPEHGPTVKVRVATLRWAVLPQLTATRPTCVRGTMIFALRSPVRTNSGLLAK